MASLVQTVTRLRVAWYRRLWTCQRVVGRPELRAPVMLAGEGHVRFGQGVILGWEQSPLLLSGYTYIEARGAESRVAIGDRTHCNNGVTIISEATEVSIGSDCFLGPMVQIYDSDFHAVEPERRSAEPPLRAPVRIGDHVFIGASAIILKGVRVGDGSVIGAGAVVTRDVPERSMAAGNPARARPLKG
jgi:acetyltransferase-like isoleucine patch superfamily enzyme